MFEGSADEINTTLSESAKLEPTGLLTSWFLHYYLGEYLARVQFTAKGLLTTEGMKRMQNYLVKPREIYKLLEEPEVILAQEGFTAVFEQALKHYGVADREDIQRIVEEHDIAFLWRDALKSADSLRLYQFFNGPADPQPPVFYKHVYEFADVNSAVRAIAGMPRSGILLFLIREKDHSDRSWFGFGYRNGGRVFILTDRHRPGAIYDSWKPPLHDYTSERLQKERSMVRRPKHHFPYDLMVGSGRVTAEAGAVTVYDGESVDGVRALPISKLRGDDLTWTILMFGMIKDRFWREGRQLDALSYTGGMILRELDVPQPNAVLVLDSYQSLNLPPLTLADLSPEKMIQYFVSGGENRWMDERYGHQVDPEVLNLVGSPQYLPGAEVGMTDRTVSHLVDEGFRNRFELHALSLTGWGKSVV